MKAGGPSQSTVLILSTFSAAVIFFFFWWWCECLCLSYTLQLLFRQRKLKLMSRLVSNNVAAKQKKGSTTPLDNTFAADGGGELGRVIHANNDDEALMWIVSVEQVKKEENDDALEFWCELTLTESTQHVLCSFSILSWRENGQRVSSELILDGILFAAFSVFHISPSLFIHSWFGGWWLLPLFGISHIVKLLCDDCHSWIYILRRGKRLSYVIILGISDVLSVKLEGGRIFKE